jgi:hypothetical protein
VALQGTIQDFGLADIFQLIGIQRKSGVLTLSRQREQVVVRFVDGQVVGAENVGTKSEDLLGAVLVRTGRIAQPQLDEALAIQRKTLQRLGYVLLDRNFISPEDLRDALQTQVEQIVYRLFRWREGEYQFDAQEHVEFDPNFTPIGAETILMEGARMVDEWPIIERKIKSDRMILRKSAAAAELDRPVESIVDSDVDLSLGVAGDAPDTTGGEISLSPEEREVFRLVDGTAAVHEIGDLSRLGEFDTYRILADLLTRNLIEEVEVVRQRPDAVPVNRSGRFAAAVLLAVVLGAAGLGVATLSGNRYSAWKVAGAPEIDDRLRTYTSRGRIERIERSVRAFFLDRGQLPDGLPVLVANGYLDERDVVDPWGRPYGLDVASNSYTISGLNAHGEVSQDLTLIRTLTPAQRRMLVDELSASF